VVHTDKQHDQAQQPQTRRQEHGNSHQARGIICQGQVDVLVKEAHEGLHILLDTHLGSSAAANEQHLLLWAQPLHLLHHLLLDPVEGLCASKLLGSLLIRHKNLKCASHVMHCSSNIMTVRQLAWQSDHHVSYDNHNVHTVT